MPSKHTLPFGAGQQQSFSSVVSSSMDAASCSRQDVNCCNGHNAASIMVAGLHIADGSKHVHLDLAETAVSYL